MRIFLGLVPQNQHKLTSDVEPLVVVVVFLLVGDPESRKHDGRAKLARRGKAERQEILAGDQSAGLAGFLKLKLVLATHMGAQSDRECQLEVLAIGRLQSEGTELTGDVVRGFLQ